MGRPQFPWATCVAGPGRDLPLDPAQLLETWENQILEQLEKLPLQHPEVLWDEIPASPLPFFSNSLDYPHNPILFFSPSQEQSSFSQQPLFRRGPAFNGKDRTEAFGNGS